MREYRPALLICTFVFLVQFTNTFSQWAPIGRTIFSIKPDLLKKSKKDTINPWTFDGNLILNFSQIWFEKWVAGGDNSISGNNINVFNINYKGKKIYWENTIKVAGGLLQQQGERALKTDDKFEIITKFGRSASKKWSYSGQCNFYSQFLPGYKNAADTIKRSDFLAPAYAVTSFGMNFKPIEQLAVQFSPVAGRITIVNSQHVLNLDPKGGGAFGVPKDKKAVFEFGGSVIVSAKGTFWKKFNYQSNLSSFSNFKKEPLTNIDVNWELLLGLRLTKLVSANLKTNVLYDIDSPEDFQFKEFLGLGFSYKI